MTQKSTAKFGFVSWDEPTPLRNNGSNFNKEDRLPFMRLKDGNNLVRVITDVATYYQVRYKAPNEKGFGTRVNTAWPMHDDCPAVAAGMKPKRRYLVGVIDRADNTVKILDMSPQIQMQLEEMKDDIEIGKATEFDINIKKNPGASPNSYYRVKERPKTPLSEADLALKTEFTEKLHEQITRLSTPPSSESVLKRLQKLGFTGEKVVEEKAENPSLPASSDDDYSFDRPPAPAN